MKRILLPFDGINFSEGIFEFAQRLNDLSPVLLTGVFLPQNELANLWSYADAAGNSIIPIMEEISSERVQQNIEKFEKLCAFNKIPCKVHRDFYDFGIAKLKSESLFADLIILSSEEFYKQQDTGTINPLLEDAMHSVKCPVLVIPEKFIFPDNIILAFDGSENSLYAIKQFAYLFPEFSKLPTSVVYANENTGQYFAGKALLEELLEAHFTNFSFMKTDINPDKFFSTWLHTKHSSLLVSGAYGRSGISQLFKKSFVKEIIEDRHLPLFVAHK